MPPPDLHRNLSENRASPAKIRLFLRFPNRLPSIFSVRQSLTDFARANRLADMLRLWAAAHAPALRPISPFGLQYGLWTPYFGIRLNTGFSRPVACGDAGSGSGCCALRNTPSRGASAVLDRPISAFASIRALVALFRHSPQYGLWPPYCLRQYGLCSGCCGTAAMRPRGGGNAAA